MSWNYRLLACKELDDISFVIHTVYYDDNDNPISYGEPPVYVVGNSLDEIYSELSRMKRAADRPILWHGDDFPKEYKPK